MAVLSGKPKVAPVKFEGENVRVNARVIRMGSNTRQAQYIFSATEVLHFYLNSKSFRKNIDSGRYIYIDGRIVLKHKKCIKVNEEGRLSLKRLPDEELALYCLKKEYHYSRPVRHSYPACNRHNRRAFKASIPKAVVTFEQAQKINSSRDLTADNLVIFLGGGGGDLPFSFSVALTQYMDESGVTVECLAEETGLSEKTIQRLRNNPDIQPSIETVIAICVGLHLDPYRGEMLLHLAGYTLTNKKRDRIYKVFIGFAYKDTVLECNNALIRCGLKPLTNLHN